MREKFNSQVNDLTPVSNLYKFPDNGSPNENFMEKKIRKEGEANEIKTRKEKAPVPLYSLVKNVCENGYVMDENGVCQKAIVLKSGKE
ncbi:hypothetical protein Phum_PHUM250820 [Pediculus humanus corporis]|uniref:Uncharacterized protein n=1 Tax=Pediculus humanus subsp. corporis TaxID=121224 RepID=E0VJU4_PEDHC|nr:uncharacterized protein Phum_PHUM250820 [Pediculus humanus corporis]EEB13650.1 hypothetical protein Phum_PHUM250820 [Pediculus humanus corporis]